MRTQFSKIRKKCPSVILMIFKAFSFSLFLIHRFACSCGSIILFKTTNYNFNGSTDRSYRGHRRPLVTKIAFSVLKSSRGKPCVTHCRMENASASTLIIDGLSDTGMLCSLQPPTQCATSYRKNWIDADPSNEMHLLPVDRMQEKHRNKQHKRQRRKHCR